MSKKLNQYVFLTGSVASLPTFDFCMDNASHLLNTVTREPIRLKAKNNNKGVIEKLNKYENAKCIVTVYGIFSWVPECRLFDVCWIGLQNEFIDDLNRVSFRDGTGEFPHGNTY